MSIKKQNDEIFCKNCGNIIKKKAIVCKYCGEIINSHKYKIIRRNIKNKALAVFLAIFFGFFTYLYTYARDSWKFWLGLGLNIGFSVIAIVWNNIMKYAIYPVGEILFFIVLLIWILGNIIFVIIDVVTKSKEFYKNYPYSEL